MNMIMNLLVPQNAGNVFTSGETLASHTGLWPVQLVNSSLILVSSSSNVYLATLLRNVISAVSTLCSRFHGCLILQCCILMVG